MRGLPGGIPFFLHVAWFVALGDLGHRSVLGWNRGENPRRCREASG
jgi:hypothetical protein